MTLSNKADLFLLESCACTECCHAVDWTSESILVEGLMPASYNQVLCAHPVWGREGRWIPAPCTCERFVRWCDIAQMRGIIRRRVSP